MAQAQQLQLFVNGPISQTTVVSPQADEKNHMMRWLRVALYAIFAVFGQTSALLLSRLYYQKGGTSKWVETLTQFIGFPILLPYYISQRPKATTASPHPPPPPPDITSVDDKTKLSTLVFVYVYLGLLMAANGYLYSIGFQYLPVSIVTLISASQLGFNALFSYFLNSQKFTPFIINSLLLLTASSFLIVSNNTSDEKPHGVSNKNYALGLICTIFATAIYGLLLASQQLIFRKVFNNISTQSTLKVVMDLTIYPSVVASIVTLIGFFGSGDYKLLNPEMDSYELGKASFVMVLVWTGVCWQVSTFAGVGLVFELSALFANVILALGLPINTTAAIIVFNDKMNGVKGISMVLAIWGVISYAYQQYLDDCNAKTKGSEVNEH